MTLPVPNPLALAHSEKLSQLIRQEINNKEFISFSFFMELSLYTPGLGYYSAGSHKLGIKGDFVTAPEISPLFAQCLARQCQQILNELPEGDILEIGAGTGILARDLLLELERLNALPRHYYILEISADLRERQHFFLKTTIPHLLYKFIWLDSLSDIQIKGIIFANEVLDALPVDCFTIEENSIKERCVTWQDNQFSWKTINPISDTLTQQISILQKQCNLGNQYQSEINLRAPAWINSIAHCLNTGIVLLFDYGYGQQEYYHPDRSNGTLMCYYQHHKHTNPLTLVGLQDITAHVNFTQIIESAINAGLKLAGYTTQSSFLLASGLTEIVQQQVEQDEVKKYIQNQEIKRLTLPSQMGEAIKVMGLSRDFDTPLKSFLLHSRIRDL